MSGLARGWVVVGWGVGDAWPLDFFFVFFRCHSVELADASVQQFESRLVILDYILQLNYTLLQCVRVWSL